MENNQNAVSAPVARVAIHRISEVDWHLVDHTSEINIGPNLVDQVKIGVNFLNRVEPNNKLTFIRTGISYQFKQPTTDPRPMLSYTVDMVYEIENFFDIFVETSNEQYEVPDLFLQSLCGIALSTVRGMLVAKTANTYLRDVYLPILGPNDLVKILQH